MTSKTALGMFDKNHSIGAVAFIWNNVVSIQHLNTRHNVSDSLAVLQLPADKNIELLMG